MAGDRKYGRNKEAAKRYLAEGRLAKNKARTARRQAKLKAAHVAKRSALCAV